MKGGMFRRCVLVMYALDVALLWTDCQSTEDPLAMPPVAHRKTETRFDRKAVAVTLSSRRPRLLVV